MVIKKKTLCFNFWIVKPNFNYYVFDMNWNADDIYSTVH